MIDPAIDAALTVMAALTIRAGQSRLIRHD
jgi:hypothetical protein